MWWLGVLAAVSCVAQLAANAEGYAPESKVLQLRDADDWSNAVQENRFVLVKFVERDDLTCEKLRYEFEVAANLFAEREVEGGLVFASIDVDKAPGLALKFGVSATPTVKWVEDGLVADFLGGRRNHTMVKWILRQTSGEIVHIHDLAALDQLRSRNDALAVGVFDDPTCPQAVRFKEMSLDHTRLQGLRFVMAHNIGSLQLAGLRSGVVTVYRQDDGAINVCENFEPQALLSCLQVAMHPLIERFTLDKSNIVRKPSDRNTLLLLLGDRESSEDVLDQARRVALKLKGQFRFMSAPRSDVLPHLFFDVPVVELPAAILILMGPGGHTALRYPGGRNITELGLLSFLQAHKASIEQPLLDFRDEL